MDGLGNSEAVVNIAILLAPLAACCWGCDTAVPQVASGLDHTAYAVSPCEVVQPSLPFAVPHLRCDPQWSIYLPRIGWELNVEIEKNAHGSAS